MRAVAVLSVMFGAQVAAAAPLARADVDVGGKRVAVSLEPSGAIVIDGATVATVAPKPNPTIEAIDVLGVPTVLVTSGTTAIALEHRVSWRVVFEQPVGPVGEDGDYAVAIALAPDGIYRYQTRPGFHRCDDKPAYIFGERWAAKFQPLATLPIEVDAGAPVIAAHADPSPAPLPLLYQARIASRERGADDISALGIPAELDDGNPATAWTDVAGSSAGQFFTFEPRAGVAATQLRFVAAGARSARPRRIALVGATGAYHVDFPDATPGAAYVVDLPKQIAGCVTAVLESTYGSGTTAIAELEVFAPGERSGGAEATLAAIVASGADGAQIAKQALARRGAAAVAAIDAELQKSTDAGARARLVRALVAIKDPSAGPVLAHAIAGLRLRDEELAAALAALGTLGQLDQLAELAQDHDLGTVGRVAAVGAIAAAPGDHVALLVPLAGKGDAELRRAVIEALTAVPVAKLAPEAASAQVAAAAGDLWRAITRRSHGLASERAPAIAAMLAALPTATDYERRYRLVDGLAAIGDAAALSAVGKLLRELPPDGERAAIAQIAARALASAPRPEAFELAVELAHDRDPGVRLAALSALGGAGGGEPGPWHTAGDTNQIDRVLETALASDTWPEVRGHAAEVLGNRCARTGPARALATSVGRDPELAVRGDALVALVQCKASGTGALLAVVWDDAKLPLELRRRAVDLSVPLGDRALGDKLVARLAGWRGAALESTEALALAQSAAYAIGRLSPAGAADALLAALGDDAYPEIVAAAATGLGLLGTACPPAAKLRLRELAHSQEQQIALAAGHAVGLCGK